MQEILFMVVYRIINEQIGKVGLIYFPFLFALFLFILVLNLFSLLPFGFAVTSHLI
jgi:F-type H+-transporting ATPase subunit a